MQFHGHARLEPITARRDDLTCRFGIHGSRPFPVGQHSDERRARGCALLGRASRKVGRPTPCHTAAFRLIIARVSREKARATQNLAGRPGG